MTILKEVKAKTLNMAIEMIDKRKVNKKNEKLVVNGNALDAINLIQKYNLHPTTLKQSRSYSVFKDFPYCEKNEYVTGPTSMYGHVIYNLNIDGLCVQIKQSPNSNYESRFKSKQTTNYNNQKFVVLDIETTGLDFLVDDIIQIGIYESSTNNYVRLLPLNKKTKNTAKDINRLEEKTLKEQTALTQLEVNAIIEQFNLKENIIMIWTGKNLFDRLFLEIYFKEHNLSGLEYFNFFNAKTLVDEIKEQINIKDCSKDRIADLYDIDTYDSHDALSDCKIQKEIITNLINKNIEPLKSNAEIIKKIVSFYDSITQELKQYNTLNDNTNIFYKNEETAKNLYFNFCDSLKLKHGIVINDYDKPHKTKGAEWLDIHHIDEIVEDDIATKTQLALKNNDIKKLEELSKYNKRDRLVYANKIEHFILHSLLDIIRCVPSGGLHFLFGDIAKLEIGIFEENSKFFKLQCKKEFFFGCYFDYFLSFEKLIDIYATICRIYENKNIQEFVSSFWKLNEYSYNQQKLESLINTINKNLSNY